MMTVKIGKYQRIWLIVLIIICMVVIFLGGVNYVHSLREALTDQAVQNVLAVSAQQQQAFDNFISGDQERLHSFSEHFSRVDSDNVEELQQSLSLFWEVDAIYSVLNLETGAFYNNQSNEVHSLTSEELEEYRALTGSGARNHYTGLVGDTSMFGYYEQFIFADGVPGLMQKSYDRNKVSKTFSLSFYNDQGYAYVVNNRGDILLRSSVQVGGSSFENIFDILSAAHSPEVDIGAFRDDLAARKTGSIAFSGDVGDYVYTYVPMENVEDWYLVSIVSEEAFSEEADKILEDSQLTFILLLVVLLICAVFVLLIWRNHRDIQEKEQAIEYQEQLFDIFATYLSTNTNDVYMMLDMEDGGEIEYISPNVERVLGISTQNALEEIKDLQACTDDGQCITMGTLQNMELEESIEALTTHWTNPHTGEEKSFTLSAYTTLMQGRRRLVIYISDRTQERRAQDTLSEALKLAQVASAAKTAFLSSVSHDIRTPMNAIIGFAELLRGEADNPDVVREYTQRIDAASNHLLELINDVLDMNKIESGGTMLNLSELSLPEVIDEVNTIIRPQTNAKGQTFEIYATPLKSEHLLGDKLRINQILINLLSNAVKYTPEGGHIEMLVEELPQVMEDYSRVRFAVTDNGLGMSEEYQRVIFEPFTREETEVTHQIQGTGFGMAITKSLVDLMGGTIKVQSTLGKGSTFTVELEMRIQELEDDPHFWEKNRMGRMLVADDDVEVCLNVVGAMKRTGVVTDYATDGASAIEKMRKAREEGKPYDLVLLDWKMPDLNGLETARLIRQNYPEKIPILLFTAYDWGEIEQEARDIGISHFLPKPFFMSTFKEAIMRITGTQKALQAGEDSAVVQGKNILVVDDIEVNRIILVKILKTLGAQCDVAANGRQALETFRASEPGQYDLILMDVQMPEMDGYEATKAIRACGHEDAELVPIIAMTANAFVDDVRDAINAGMDAHVAKPIQLDKLKATIQQVFDKKALG